MSATQSRKRPRDEIPRRIPFSPSIRGARFSTGPLRHVSRVSTHDAIYRALGMKGPRGSRRLPSVDRGEFERRYKHETGPILADFVKRLRVDNENQNVRLPCANSEGMKVKALLLSTGEHRLNARISVKHGRVFMNIQRRVYKTEHQDKSWEAFFDLAKQTALSEERRRDKDITVQHKEDGHVDGRDIVAFDVEKFDRLLVTACEYLAKKGSVGKRFERSILFDAFVDDYVGEQFKDVDNVATTLEPPHLINVAIDFWHRKVTVNCYKNDH